jgi:hypothetical protein
MSCAGRTVRPNSTTTTSSSGLPPIHKLLDNKADSGQCRVPKEAPDFLLILSCYCFV